MDIQVEELESRDRLSCLGHKTTLTCSNTNRSYFDSERVGESLALDDFLPSFPASYYISTRREKRL